MFSKIDNGKCINIQGLDCWLPPAGYVFNVLTGQVERRPIIQRSSIKADQYWERIPMPDWYASRLKQEEKMQLSDPEYVDNELEKYRAQEWDRRLNGCWVMINGTPHYLTGLHYFYLQWWAIDIGYPKFRIPDMEYFYFLQYVIEDPECLGMIEVTKRRFGKSYRSGVFSFEHISRSFNADAGIQSKTSTDAKKLFSRAIIAPFKKLPKFFRPEYDQSGGITPKTEIRFQQTNLKGKRAEEVLDKPELNSGIDWQSSEAVSYDGRKLIRYTGDEVGKTTEVNVYDRHQVVMYCVLDDEGKVIGKMLYTTTVEDMENGGGSNFKELWDDSDHTSKGEYDRTPSGLYRYFTPAHKTRNFDIYGYPDEEKTLQQILKERESLKNSPRALSARIRKEPLTIEEAFRIDGDKCLYDAVKLNDRLDVLSWGDNVLEQGNFEWKGGVRDSEVVWTKSKNGRWWIPKAFHFESKSDTNKIIKMGNTYRPGNKHAFVSGLDPYDHDQTEDNKRSKAASFVLKRNNPMVGGPFNRAFVCMYFARPEFAAIMYEDMIKQCCYFGCALLFESQKPGVKRYFGDRGYGDFLMHLPGYKEPGIPSTPENKRTLAEQTEEYISNNIDSVYFSLLIKQWLDFRFDKTQLYDLAMAAGWTLVADMELVTTNIQEQTNDINQIFETFN